MQKSLTIRFCFSLAFLVLFFFGCEKEDVLDNLPQFPENAQLKQVTSFMAGSDDGYVIEVYEYDDEGRAVKITTPKPDGTGASGYKDYTYNDEGRLEKIAHYYFNINVGGYVNLQTTTFTWSAAGMKTKEEIEYLKLLSLKCVNSFTKVAGWYARTGMGTMVSL